MTKPPANPKIYHITHLNNLASILMHCGIQSDSCRLDQETDNTNIGMTRIKQRRLEKISVDCHPGTKVGEYVPFYFCSRSIMLYILHMGNHPDIEYRDGQASIIHLQADLCSTIRWAQNNKVRWAFSDRNAGTYFAQFYCDVKDLYKIDWPAVAATDFRDIRVKEGKQAEFLVHRSFPLALVEKVGVINAEVKKQVTMIFESSGLQMPVVRVEPRWYY